MRLFEIVAPRFFLRSAIKHSKGDVADMTGSLHPLGSVLEGHLERRRPDGCLPREDSLYLDQTQHKDAPYVYLVEPLSQIDRFHTGWLTMLKAANPNSEGEVDQYASGYWSGQVYPERRDEPWEYRTLQAKVLKRVGGWEIA